MMGKRKGTKTELFLSVKRKKCQNLHNYNRCKKADLPYMSRANQGVELLPINNQESSSTTSTLQSNSTSYRSTVNEEYEQDIQLVADGSNYASDGIENLKKLSSISTLEVPIEKISESEIEGRRIVHMRHFFQALVEISEHGQKFGCSLRNLKFVGERKVGLNSIFEMQCNMCNVRFKISTNEEYHDNSAVMDINTSAVEGIMSIGCGFYNLEEFLSTMDVPSMGEKTYNHHHKIVSQGWENAARLKMEEAAKAEADFAREHGHVDKNGIPCITVVADGCWSKRSYRTNYNALSGAAAILGYQTKEVLYLGVKNKYCSICINSERNKETPKTHSCYKNFTGSSTSMESTILVEGFKNSLPLYGIKYTKLIADGDSSTYKKIVEAKPYEDITVEKIECRNHILRNFCNKLKALSVETRFPLKLRRFLSTRILRLRRAVTSAIKYRKESTNCTEFDKIKKLKLDIDNSVNHVFGRHDQCDAYFCNKIEEQDVIIEIAGSNEFYNKLLNIVGSVSQHARSLVHDVDSNMVEQFHSIVVKFIGGKRINFAKGSSYQSRCYAAVVSHNSKSLPHYTLHKTMLGNSPSKIKSTFEKRRHCKVRKMLNYRHAATTSRRKRRSDYETFKDADYGIYCQQPDMDEEEYERKTVQFLQKLLRTDEQRRDFEKSTILQSGCGTWLEERRKLITSSNFHDVCCRRPYTSCNNLVKRLLYSGELIAPAIHHGKKYESVAIKQLEVQLDINIKKCGMFIDQEFPFLGATPDGILDNSTLIEIKCPYSAFNKNIDDAIQEQKIKFWKRNNEVNKNHSWYYQIQGQLRIAGRQKCLLAVFTSESKPLKVEYVERNDEFWKNKMEGKLTTFYMDCLLPEIIDSRYKRNMKIRDPQYILDAIAQKESKIVAKNTAAEFMHNN